MIYLRNKSDSGWIQTCNLRIRSAMLYSVEPRSLYYVVSRGFEPRLTVPKTEVLPLHHETNNTTLVIRIYSKNRFDKRILDVLRPLEVK